MRISLATAYRPQTFDEVLGQEVTIKILQKQLACKEYPHCYLFTGASGEGKTTLARIMAREINGGIGSPIEIDGASNNGVDNIRDLVEEANKRALAGEYKIFIIDECHQITSAAWNAFLKCLEEPPQYTIFMLCTTDPQKLPPTILSRVMRFQLSKVPDQLIVQRLQKICASEQREVVDVESLWLIAREAQGSMREALSLLERVMGYTEQISLKQTQKVLGASSYDLLFKLVNALADGVDGEVVEVVEQVFAEGNLLTFADQLLTFVLDLHKYSIFKSMDYLDTPAHLEEDVKYAVGLFPTAEENTQYFSRLADQVLQLRKSLKEDGGNKFVATALLLSMERKA